MSGISKKINPGVALHRDPTRREADAPISDSVRRVMETIEAKPRPEPEIVREKIGNAFTQAGLLVHWHRGKHGLPAQYTIMAPDHTDPNALIEKMPGLANADWEKLHYVERWEIGKELFSKSLTADIKREQSFASFTPQIIGNIRHQFPEMARAQFGGEAGTHYIIDGVLPGMDPVAFLSADARVGDEAQFRRSQYWNVKISESDMRAAVGIPEPVAQKSPI